MQGIVRHKNFAVLFISWAVVWVVGGEKTMSVSPGLHGPATKAVPDRWKYPTKVTLLIIDKHILVVKPHPRLVVRSVYERAPLISGFYSTCMTMARRTMNEPSGKVKSMGDYWISRYQLLDCTFFYHSFNW